MEGSVESSNEMLSCLWWKTQASVIQFSYSQTQLLPIMNFLAICSFWYEYKKLHTQLLFTYFKTTNRSFSSILKALKLCYILETDWIGSFVSVFVCLATKSKSSILKAEKKNHPAPNFLLWLLTLETDFSEHDNDLTSLQL